MNLVFVKIWNYKFCVLHCCDFWISVAHNYIEWWMVMAVIHILALFVIHSFIGSFSGEFLKRKRPIVPLLNALEYIGGTYDLRWIGLRFLFTYNSIYYGKWIYAFAGSGQRTVGRWELQWWTCRKWQSALLGMGVFNGFWYFLIISLFGWHL